jgi:hypothetical protein
MIVSDGKYEFNVKNNHPALRAPRQGGELKSKSTTMILIWMLTLIPRRGGVARRAGVVLLTLKILTFKLCETE